MKRRSLSARKAGLPPGTLLHIGRGLSEKPMIKAIEFTEVSYAETVLTDANQLANYVNCPGIVWLQVYGISHVPLIEQIGHTFNIHPLTLEDILNTNQRPKFEDYQDYAFTAVKMLTYFREDHTVTEEHISLIFGPNYVISLQESEHSYFKQVQERLKGNQGRFFRQGTDYLAYALLDTIVDNYFVLLESIGERIETLEDALVSRPTPKLLPDIHNLKTEMLFLRRSVWPLRDTIASIERSHSPLFHEGTRLYFRDVYDHTVQVIEAIETYRDMAYGMLDIYLSSVSNRMNEIVKTLTIISTIFMPLTFIVGLYGMNFRYMPELEWEYGYPAVLMLMTAISISMLAWFRSRHWL